MAKYSDDAKYVSAYNRGLKASNQAKLLLAELNKAKAGTPQHASIKAKYDAAKDAFTTAENERIKRKQEIDDAANNEKTDKAASKDKASAKADIPQLEFQVQAAKNAGDKAAQTAAEAALKAAKDKAAGIKPPALGNETVVKKDGLEEVANNRFKDYTINSDGSVAGPGGTRSYFVSVKNANGSSTLQEYKSVATARDAFLKNYSSPGALDKLKQQLRAKNYISAEQLKTGDWIRGIDDVLGDYTRDAVSAVKYGGAKEAPLIDAWFAKAIGGLGGSGTGSKAGTWKDTDLDLTTIGDANKEINDYMLDALGREATQEEKDAYYADINKREKASAVKTVSTRDATGKVTEATRTGDFVTAEERLNAKNAIVLKALQGTDAGEILKSAKGSQVAVQIGQLQKAAASYGQPISAGEALKYVIEGGTQKDAIAKQTERMRLNAMTMYGNLKEHIRDGGNVKDIADQYALIKSRKLGIPLTDAFNDKDVKAALTKDGGLMSTAEFARQMQANPLWRQTDEARDIASDFANTILKSFGLMG
jgi:hypothetical protein